MATASQNGWAAGETKAAAGVDTYVLDGTGITFPGGFKAGDATVVLAYVALQIHLRVEPGVPGWCWGWNYRPVRGATALSNHSSGTAFDWNAPKHPLAKVDTWSPAQRAELEAIGREVDGVVRFGFQYTGRHDDMHVELNASPAKVAVVAQRLRAMGGSYSTAASRGITVQAGPRTVAAVVATVTGATGTGTLRPGSSGADVSAWQDELWRIGYGVGEHDGAYGPATEGATLDLQRAAGLGADGIVGDATRGAAARVPTYPKAPGPALPLCGPGGPSGTVREFQARLATRGWHLSADGVYGQQTAGIVRQFQAQVGLDADGVGGPGTWSALWLRPVI